MFGISTGIVVVDLLLTALGIVVVVGTVWSSFKKLKEIWRRVVKPTVDSLQRALIVLNGREAIVRPEDGIEIAPARQSILTRMESIESEVSHNHGTSLKDAVVRTEQKVDDMGRRVHGLESWKEQLQEETAQDN